MMSVAEWRALDGIAVNTLIRKGELTADEALDAAIAAADRLNPQLNAIVARHDEHARRQSVAPDASPLSGVPFLLKDANLQSTGMPTRYASRFFANAPAQPDSDMVSAWTSAGLRIFGKTNTPEFASEFVTEPAFYGKVVNPWNAGVTVGGSSGGAAAAVAAGIVAIAHATDLGGSIRIPAACCGAYGFKPTSGRNPSTPYAKELSSGLNSDHVITRSVRDSAASLDITALRTQTDESYLAQLIAPLRTLRIGLITSDPSGRPCGPNQIEAVESVARLFEDRGDTISLIDMTEELAPGAWFDPLWVTDIAQLIDDRSRVVGRKPLPGEIEPLTALLLERFYADNPVSLATALMERDAFRQRMRSFIEPWDLLLMPSLATDPAPLGRLAFRDGPADIDLWNERGYGFAPFSAPFNVAGYPAASCPVSLSLSGLPVGVQLVAKAGEDAMILQASQFLEQATGWLGFSPGL